MKQDRTQINILFSCTGQAKGDFDPFVSEHAVTFVVNGRMVINDGNEITEFNKGDICFISKNQLLKTQKIPQDNKPFMSVSVFLPKDTLFGYSKEFNINPKGNYTGSLSFVFHNDIFLDGYLKSMMPYFEDPSSLTTNLAKFKTLELIEILIKNKSIQNILFNFNEEFKIDLEAYMNRNYMHNIPLEQFAKLTGRSLSTFKRDFEEIFNTTPKKWLMKKKLDLAYYLISSEGRKPSEIYFDTGFVNFSHFSKSFKTEFGVSPSELGKK